MAFTAKHNITTNTPQTLIAAGDNAGNIRSINLANIHDTTAVDINLWIVNCGKLYYIIKNVTVPAGVTLQLDTSDININTNTGQDALRIKLSAAVAVDVIINT